MPMNAASAAYYFFVVAVFLLYWISARARLARLGIVLLANLFFCAHFGLFYVVLLPTCALVDYLVGAGIQRSKSNWLRRPLLAVSVVMNLGLLIGSRHMGAILAQQAPGTWEWVFPLGLSFYTFQALTYTFDIYRRDAAATNSLLAHVASVTFFPTLTAGPITRVSELVRQFTKNPVLSRTDGGRAFGLIALGLLKKTLIADYLAETFVNRVFDTPNLYSGAEVLIAVYAYSFQLYFDFSGYTDIARGIAQLLGINLPINFDQPYRSLNVTEFWRRWHISFSNWLRDYLYFSLPGKRTKVMPYLNLIVTMVLGGLWHGLTWTFAVWGVLHGVALAVARLWQTWRGRPKQPSPWWSQAIRILITYHFVCLTWIFFRAASMDDALALLGRIGSLTAGFENVSWQLAGVLAAAVALHFINKKHYTSSMDLFARMPFYVHAAALLAVAIAVQMLAGQSNANFVYSRF